MAEPEWATTEPQGMEQGVTANQDSWTLSGQRLYSAGEACSVDAFQCVSGAMESGQRVATHVQTSMNPFSLHSAQRAEQIAAASKRQRKAPEPRQGAGSGRPRKTARRAKAVSRYAVNGGKTWKGDWNALWATLVKVGWTEHSAASGREVRTALPTRGTAFVVRMLFVLFVASSEDII